MRISHKSLYLLVNAAILTAAGIEFVRGYKLLIVLLAGATWLIVGNATVFLAGKKQRAADRQRKRDYYAGS
jgi:hypothetical protein